MTKEEEQLWQKLSAFQFDDPESPFPFRVRLAKENRWTLAYTARVCEEYRRFLFLGAQAGHPVSPSDPVDQAWHLHLLYTRNYWEDLCQNVLGMPFHHSPTKGGMEESTKFEDWYSKTLQSYERLFRSQAPRDIWPHSPVHDPHVRVNLRRNWVFPKFSWGRGA